MIEGQIETINGCPALGGRYDGIIASTAVIRAVLAAVMAFALVVMAARATSDLPPKIWEDKSTGCEYILHSGGASPRYDGSGRHLGCRWVDPDTGAVVAELGMQRESIVSSVTLAYSKDGKQLFPDSQCGLTKCP